MFASGWTNSSNCEEILSGEALEDTQEQLFRKRQQRDGRRTLSDPLPDRQRETFGTSTVEHWRPEIRKKSIKTTTLHPKCIKETVIQSQIGVWPIDIFMNCNFANVCFCRFIGLFKIIDIKNSIWLAHHQNYSYSSTLNCILYDISPLYLPTRY